MKHACYDTWAELRHLQLHKLSPKTKKIDFCPAFIYEVYIFAKECSLTAPQRPPWGQRKVFVIEKRQLWGGRV